MLTIVTTDHYTQTLWARALDADAASGDLVLLGIPTDSEIRAEANEQLAAPECGTYTDYDVAWVETPSVPEQ